MAGFGWTVTFLGPVSTYQVTPCGAGIGSSCAIPPVAGTCEAWSGPHLHQSELFQTTNYNSGVSSAGNPWATSSTWIEHLSD